MLSRLLAPSFRAATTGARTATTSVRTAKMLTANARTYSTRESGESKWYASDLAAVGGAAVFGIFSLGVCAGARACEANMMDYRVRAAYEEGFNDAREAIANQNNNRSFGHL